MKKQRGAVAIEMALVLPLFCLMLFGLIDYGYYFMVDLAATNAVREGARAATTIAGACPNGAATTEASNAITTYLTNVGLASLQKNISCNCNTIVTGPQFTCTLQLDFPRVTGYSLVPMPSSAMGASYTSLTTNATMRGSN